MYLGRPMAVDWSLPKNVYEKMHKQGSSERKMVIIMNILF